jgi:predicted MFS family arabinose efflux permease
MRRLAVFVSAIAVAETVIYSSLAPMLPSFEERWALSKAQVGLLVALFPVGMIIAALPVGLVATRLGVRRSIAMGLVGLAATSLAFALSESYGVLLVIRFLQGAAGALCWSNALAWLVSAVSSARRSEMIGLFSGAGAAGAAIGPMVGALAVVAGRLGVFAGVAGLIVLLAIFGARVPSVDGGGRHSQTRLPGAHRWRAFVLGQWLVAVPGLLLGTITVLAPLQLSSLGWGAAEIAVTFLVAAVAGVLARPLIGRWADKRGLESALRALLLGSIPATLAIPWPSSARLLSILVVLAITAYGVVWGPAMALVSHVNEQAGVAHPLGFALMNACAGLGIVIGAAGGGIVAQLAGDFAAYSLAAAMCLATVVTLARARPPDEGTSDADAYLSTC